MLKLFATCLALFVNAVFSAVNTDPSTTRDFDVLVINGQRSEYVPWFALTPSDNGCGATVIHPNYAITAAH